MFPKALKARTSPPVVCHDRTATPAEPRAFAKLPFRERCARDALFQPVLNRGRLSRTVGPSSRPRPSRRNAREFHSPGRFLDGLDGVDGCFQVPSRVANYSLNLVFETERWSSLASGTLVMKYSQTPEGLGIDRPNRPNRPEERVIPCFYRGKPGCRAGRSRPADRPQPSVPLGWTSRRLARPADQGRWRICLTG